MRHRWSPENDQGEQDCLNGCGQQRCAIVPYSPRAQKPTPHYRTKGLSDRGRSHRWHEFTTPCAPNAREDARKGRT